MSGIVVYALHYEGAFKDHRRDRVGTDRADERPLRLASELGPPASVCGE